MKYISTRMQSNSHTFSETLIRGLAPDGGLFVPEKFPFFTEEQVATMLRQEERLPHSPYPQFAAQILAPFLVDDSLENQLSDICQEAFTFPIPLVDLDAGTSVLELFHGPTAAFKDVGARFLASCLSRIAKDRGVRFHILVATSGDTGGAVASAFFKKPNTRVTILFPKGKVSPFQEKQLTAWGENITSFAVRGTFDDCQRMAKEALSRVQQSQDEILTSSNSISLGRLLPQMIYYAHSSLAHLHRHGCRANYLIPSGNLGNAVSAFYAKQIGFPLNKIVLVQNANHPLVNYIESGHWQTHPSIPTLANAMDVGNPSNMERVRHLFPTLNDIKTHMTAYSVTDAEIEEAITLSHSRWNQVWCPHTATAAWIRLKQSEEMWTIVSTAHAAKFANIVEPLVKRNIPIPESLNEIIHRPSSFKEIDPEVKELCLNLN